MRVVSLGSGSSGNATLLRTAAGESILIDCGVTPARLLRHLARVGVAPASLAAVVLTHDHGDHVQAAPVLAARFGVPLFASPITATRATLDVLHPHVYPTDTDTPWRVGGFTLVTHRVPHDADETFGFTVMADGVRVALFTDLGSDADTVAPALARADLLIVEANHDRAMLQGGDYPWWLKSRIGGHNGHLSNDQCATLLSHALTDDRPRDIWLAHLSAQNNTPARAMETVASALAAAGITRARVAALPRTEIGPRWEMTRAQQLSLFDEGE